MDIVDDESFVFQWTETGKNQEGMVHQTASRMIYSNPEGDVHITDLRDIYLEKGIARIPALSVRRLSLEEIEQDTEGRCLWRGKELTVFEDGTTALHKAKAFLESCTSAPRQYPELNNIIYEELEAMYADDRDPEQVAEIIDNRIQTYLNEEN